MKLLLVEDDLDLGNGVRLALQDQRIDVTWVRRIAEAEPLLDEGTCDLLVLDLGLPDGNGLSLLARVRRERSDLPILILTARDGLDDRLRGLDGGADDYVVKPFALAELLSRIRHSGAAVWAWMSRSLKCAVWYSTKEAGVSASMVERSNCHPANSRCSQP